MEIDAQPNVSKVSLKDFNANNFNRGAGKVKEVCWYIIKVVFFLSPLPFPSSVKAFLLKAFGARVGSRVILKPRINIHFPWKLDIGNDVWIGEEAYILNFEKVIIGDNVCISQRAFLCGGNHNYKDPSMPYRNGPITLLDGCWVGACCFVGPNVVIGIDAVITASSVVTNSLADNGVYRGNPAAFVKYRW
ncbi:WcaF family extracellular polysaccharide biosynthesis acetyltransferase [Mucilaginibacter sp. PAMB04274]|uniref:WcaF family extracellular polysaccharide biosynthesis acetyltransferase n=1 Tax=Mucilaginibacter sp. PAMB04274 TaxID=3138568 RepID=UPI0031F6EBE6